GKQDAFAGWEKVATGHAAFARAHHLWNRGFSAGRVDWNRIHLIAGNAFALMHEDQILVIGRKIGLGVGSSKRELANVAQMFFRRKSKRGRRRLLRMLSLRIGHERRTRCEKEKKHGSGDAWFLHGLFSLFE